MNPLWGKFVRTLLNNLDAAPELRWEDLEAIKVPIDLLELIPLPVCRRLKTVPLRMDARSKIMSLAFVDPQIQDELENLRLQRGLKGLSTYRISEGNFERLICELSDEVENEAFQESKESLAQSFSIALVEQDAALRNSFSILLRAQGYDVLAFESEAALRSQIKDISDKLADEDHLLQRRKLIPFDTIIARSSALEMPKTFCDYVWAHLGQMKITLFEDRWFHRLLEQGQTAPLNSSADLEFHLKHENFYLAARECLKTGNIFQAVELLEKVNRENAYFLKAKLLLGKAFLQKKNFNKAASHFQSAYDHWCEDPGGVVDATIIKILYHLAFAFEKMGRFDDALRLYERVAGEDAQYKDIGARMSKVREQQRKANATQEKKMGLPAFSPNSRATSRYDRIDEIGRGGMGIVYRAKDRVLGREVALKVLSSHLKHDDKIVETFLREAKSLASLNHLNIVTIFDAGVEDGNYYIAMEYIEGRTVRDILKKRGRFRIPTALTISKQVLKALSFAHSKHVIHRDITTNNMMLTDTKVVKIMDFGLARVVNQLHSEQSIIGGTPYFMSPEQVEGAPIDHRTDLYSFGVCLYEMLTGQVPFPMENPGYHHLHTPAPDPRALLPQLPESIAQIINKCLQKKAQDRFQSADEIQALLRNFLGSA